MLVGCLIQHTQELEQDLHRSDPPGAREEDILLCIDKASSALASLLLHLPTHESMHSIAGLETVVSICKVSRNGRVLRALAQVIAAMVPSPQHRKVIMKYSFCLLLYCFPLLCVSVRSNTFVPLFSRYNCKSALSMEYRTYNTLQSLGRFPSPINISITAAMSR